MVAIAAMATIDVLFGGVAVTAVTVFSFKEGHGDERTKDDCNADE